MSAGTQISVEEYLRTSYPDGDREYVDGEVRERNLGEYDHADVQTAIVVWLRQNYKKLGLKAVVEQRVQVSRTRFRVPDVTAFLGAPPASGIITEPPLLVVEVLSKDDRAGDAQEKIDDYLDFGVPYVWVVDPRRRRAEVYTPGGRQTVRDGVLRTADPVIEVPLSELFEK